MSSARNQPCSCGSGKKLKRCCQDPAIAVQIDGPISEETKTATRRMLAEEGYTAVVAHRARAFEVSRRRLSRISAAAAIVALEAYARPSTRFA